MASQSQQLFPGTLAVQGTADRAKLHNSNAATSGSHRVWQAWRNAIKRDQKTELVSQVKAIKTDLRSLEKMKVYTVGKIHNIIREIQNLRRQADILACRLARDDVGTSFLRCWYRVDLAARRPPAVRFPSAVLLRSSPASPGPAVERSARNACGAGAAAKDVGLDCEGRLWRFVGLQ